MKVGDIVLGKYRIDRELGRGGMGVVVAATNIEIEQKVALKLLLPERSADEKAIARVVEEARATVKLSGLHTGKVLDVARLPSGQPVLVMVLLEGEDLAQRLARSGPLPEAQVIDLMREACDGLAEAHGLGIIHRDVKPSNLFLAREVDGTDALKVIDFGVAKVQSADPNAMTATQAVVGSVEYMSPEQLRKRPLDARTDVWSLGVVMYELLAKKRPFPADSVTDASIRIAVEPPEPLPANVSAKLKAIVMRCLEKEPERRFKSMVELAAALRDASTTATASTPTAPGRRARGKLLVALVGLAAVAAAVSALVLTARAPKHDGQGGRESAPSLAKTQAKAAVTPAAALKFQFVGCRAAVSPLPYYSVLDEARVSATGNARDLALGAARQGGILGNTALVQGGAFASLTGTGDISSSFDDTNIYGGLLGSDADEMTGGAGFGRSGFGPSGSGTGWGTGRYGTIGHGTGSNSLGNRHSEVPTVSIGQPNADGDLDKAIIRHYIKRNIQRIQYCYEKELLAKPTLEGTVNVQFFITPTGTVGKSEGVGVDPSVASCVADVIHNIEFPKPKGGGGVQVEYPFTFHRAEAQTVAPRRPPLTHRHARPMFRLAPRAVMVDRTQWTPFATLLSTAPPDIAASVSEATSKALAPELAAVEACLPPDRPAALRAMIVVHGDGTTSARVGGDGDAAVERCVANAIAGVKVETATHPDVEVACDAMRGDDPSWKVTPDAGYTIVEVTKQSFRNGADEWAFADISAKKQNVKPWPALAAGGLYLVIVDADAPMSNLVFVLNLIAATRQSVVVALRESTSAPTFAFAIDDNAHEPPQQQNVSLQIADHQVDLCSTTTTAPSGNVADPAAIDATLAAGIASCKQKDGCTSADVLAAPDASATELLAVTSHIRRAGIEQVRFVQQRATCAKPVTSTSGSSGSNNAESYAGGHPYGREAPDFAWPVHFYRDGGFSINLPTALSSEITDTDIAGIKWRALVGGYAGEIYLIHFMPIGNQSANERKALLASTISSEVSRFAADNSTTLLLQDQHEAEVDGFPALYERRLSEGQPSKVLEQMAVVEPGIIYDVIVVDSIGHHRSDRSAYLFNNFHLPCVFPCRSSGQ